MSKSKNDKLKDRVEGGVWTKVSGIWGESDEVGWTCRVKSRTCCKGSKTQITREDREDYIGRIV